MRLKRYRLEGREFIGRYQVTKTSFLYSLDFLEESLGVKSEGLPIADYVTVKGRQHRMVTSSTAKQFVISQIGKY